MSWKFWQPSLPREVEEEIEFHLEMRVRELISAGMGREAARDEAARRLGDRAVLARKLLGDGRRRDRTIRRVEWMREFRQDLGYGVRTLLRNPGFATIAVLTLGLGVGGTTAIFSAVNAVVLRPLPVPDVDRVMLLSESWKGRPGSVSVGNFTDIRSANEVTLVFAALGAISWRSVTLGLSDQPERILGARVTPDYFSVMGIAARYGRVFSVEEDMPGGPHAVVLSERLWARRFGSDPAIVGHPVMLNGEPHTVVGVMPAAFDFSAGTEELWLPAAYLPAERTRRDEHFLTVYARLRPGVSQRVAQARLDEVMRRLRQQFPVENAEAAAGLQPMMGQFVGDAKQQLFLILGAVALVLLIACANVANLLLARGATRSRELAIRASIGAGRGRLVRQLIAESTALALAAGVAGVGVAWLAIRTLILAAPPGVPRLERSGLDLATLAFALVLSLGSVLLFGILPAFRSAGVDLQRTLRTGHVRAGATSRDWLRQSLVATEVAFALMLLVGASLLIRTAVHLQRIDPGFDPRGVLSARVSLPPERYGTPDLARHGFESVLENLIASPGVRRGALATQVPMGPGTGDNGLIPEGKPLAPESAVPSRFRLVSPGYFASMGMPIRRGRDFTPDDRNGAPRAMLVNETLARALFPGQDPVGKRVACCEGEPNDPRWKTIVGVVADTRSYGPDQAVDREFFLPIAQAPDAAWDWIGRTMTLVASGTDDAPSLAPAMRAALSRVDPAVPLYGITTMEERISGALAPARFRTALLGSLAAVGLLLALVGIYGVIAYLVTRRRGEIGVRMALGASPGAVLRLVVGQGLRPVLMGVALGVGGSVLTTRFLGTWLRGVSATDPVTFAAVAALVVSVGLLASVGPAWRATKVDALEAIRTE